MDQQKSGNNTSKVGKIIVDREREIKAFKSTPFWQIQLLGKIKEDIEAWHKEDKFWEKEKAMKVMSNVKGQKQGKVASIDSKSFDVAPPNPFDLTTMQIEAYRTLKISPKDTLSIAQDLYTSGFISYPRTSSQKIPEAISPLSIIKRLSKSYIRLIIGIKLLILG